jgi:hypothetical protein
MSVRPRNVSREGGYAADLTESLVRDYGHRVPLDLIARVVHDVLDEHVHPRGEPVTEALTREAVRRLRRLVRAVDRTAPPQRSERAQAIAKALQARQ